MLWKSGNALVERVMISFQQTGCIKGFPAYIHTEPHMHTEHGRQNENHQKEGHVGMIIYSSYKIKSHNLFQILNAVMTKVGAEAKIKCCQEQKASLTARILCANDATHGKQVRSMKLSTSKLLAKVGLIIRQLTEQEYTSINHNIKTH